ncbi:hypothetical protein PQX77_015531 [Marasmius sp. AFHP31]|nr:hypothetical protein PQX77_015531 [Marasmius sp. AFHP31]
MAYFKYSLTKDQLQTKLTNLSQGKETADKFVTQFKAIMNRTSFSDKALLYWFKEGLNNGLRKVDERSIGTRQDILDGPGIPVPKEWINLGSGLQEYKNHNPNDVHLQTGNNDNYHNLYNP